MPCAIAGGEGRGVVKSKPKKEVGWRQVCRMEEEFVRLRWMDAMVGALTLLLVVWGNNGWCKQQGSSSIGFLRSPMERAIFSQQQNTLQYDIVHHTIRTIERERYSK